MILLILQISKSRKDVHRAESEEGARPLFRSVVSKDLIKLPVFSTNE